MKRSLILMAATTLAMTGCDLLTDPSNSSSEPEADQASIWSLEGMMAQGLGMPRCSPGWVPTVNDPVFETMAAMRSINSPILGDISAYVPGSLTAVDISGGAVMPTQGFDINDSETIAGFGQLGGAAQAAIWPIGATSPTFLSLPGSPTTSIAYAINNFEQVAGAMTVSGLAMPFIRHPSSGGAILPLPPGGAQGGAYAINNYGQVAGFAVGSFGVKPALWTPTVQNGTSFTVTLLDGGDPTLFGFGYGMNNNGDVVGQISRVGGVGGVPNNPGPVGAFVWTAGSPNGTSGTFQNIGVAPGTYVSRARDINDHGAVVGYGEGHNLITGGFGPGGGTTTRRPLLAFYWTPAGGYHMLPAPSGPGWPNQGGATGQAFQINNHGTVIGRVATAFTFFEQRMFTWRADTHAMELYPKLATACSSGGFGINECGVMTGWNLDPNAPEGQNTFATKYGTCAVGGHKLGADGQQIVAGQPLRFEVRAVNRSSEFPLDVTAYDPLPNGPGFNWQIESISNNTGTNGTCDITGPLGAQELNCFFPQLPRAGGHESVIVRTETLKDPSSCKVYSNSVFVASADTDRASGSGSANVTVVCLPELKVQKSGSSSAGGQGSTVSFNMSVTNSGVGPATGVILTDTLPSGPGLNWTVSGGSARETCQIQGGVLTCNVGTLAIGATSTVSVSAPASAESCTTYQNTVRVRASNHGPVSAQAQATVACAPELVVVKAAGATTVQPGDPISFTMTASAHGGGVLEGVRLTDRLPGGLGIEWTITTQSGNTCRISGVDPQVLTCDFGVLPGGESRTVTVQSATVGLSCGTYGNTVSVAAAGTDPKTASAAVSVPCADLPPIDPNAICQGGVTSMTLRYIGSQPLTAEVRGQRKAPGGGQRPVLGAQTKGVGSNTLYTFAIQPLGGLFDPVSNGRLANEFALFIGSSEIATVHMSCSVPIYPGMKIAGLFEIVELRFGDGSKATLPGGGGSNGGGGDGGDPGDGDDGDPPPTQSFATYTIGGWGSSPAGNNPGRLLHDNFQSVYGNLVEIGRSGAGGAKRARFSSASAITAYLPAGGTPGHLTKNHDNPTSTEAGVFAAQVLGLSLNVDFSAAGVTTAGLGAATLTSGPLSGKTVDEVLAFANEALATGQLPAGVSSISQLNSIVDAINNGQGLSGN